MKSNDVLHSHDIGHLLHQVPENTRKLFRKYESLSKKSIKKKWSNTFNSVCLKENSLPVYTNIYKCTPVFTLGKNDVHIKCAENLKQCHASQN